MELLSHHYRLYKVLPTWKSATPTHAFGMIAQSDYRQLAYFNYTLSLE